MTVIYAMAERGIPTRIRTGIHGVLLDRTTKTERWHSRYCSG
jgi:hypothetical protein